MVVISNKYEYLDGTLDRKKLRVGEKIFEKKKTYLNGTVIDF